MGIAFPGKGFLSLGCCLVVVSGLAAQVNNEKPVQGQDRPPTPVQGQDRPPTQDRGASPNDRPQPPAGLPLPYSPPTPLQMPNFHTHEERAKASETAVRWILGILGAISAGLAGLGTSQALRKKTAPPTGTPKTRTEELGLGVDGKGGVWRREVPPWV
jgi:hypothetical protein